MHRVEEHLGADGVRAPADLRDVDDRSGRVRRDGARDQPRPVAEHGIEIGGMQPAVGVADAPPDDSRADALERQPRRDVRLVIQFADDDLGPRRQRLADGEADRADERRRVEAERDLVGAARVDEGGDARARARDHGVDLARMAVRTAALHVAREEMIGHGVDDRRRNLRARGVVEEDEAARARDRREPAPHIVDRKRIHRRGGVLLPDPLVGRHGRRAC